MTRSRKSYTRTVYADPSDASTRPASLLPADVDGKGGRQADTAPPTSLEQVVRQTEEQLARPRASFQPPARLAHLLPPKQEVRHEVGDPFAVTKEDIDAWLHFVMDIDPNSPRRDYVVKGWNVVEKIQRAKAAGNFETILCEAANPVKHWGHRKGWTYPKRRG